MYIYTYIDTYIHIIYNLFCISEKDFQRFNDLIHAYTHTHTHTHKHTHNTYNILCFSEEDFQRLNDLIHCKFLDLGTSSYVNKCST